MTQMKTKLINHLKTLRFWVRNFDLMKERYGTYREADRQSVLGNAEVEVNDHLANLDDNIYTELRRHPHIWIHYTTSIKENFKEGVLCKAKIRLLKTEINNITRKLNKNFVEWMFDYDNIRYAKNHKYAQRLYVEHYVQINKIMGEALKDILLDLLDDEEWN